MPRPGPVDRIRGRLAARAGPAAAAALPSHYQRLGRVALVRWPEPLRSEFPVLAAELATALGVVTVARIAGPTEGARRTPNVELLYGTETVTEVLEDGIRYRFDAARLLYSRGNRAERARLARLGVPGEAVADLFAGIGYFALPLARHGRPRRVVAVEENPVSYAFLVEHIRRNRLGSVVSPVLGDNRVVALPERSFDRVLLGYLPDATPWLPRAVALLAPAGGWIHLHRTAGSRDDPAAATPELRAELDRAGGRLLEVADRRVKAYGPGRDHRVLDLRVRPDGPTPEDGPSPLATVNGAA